MLGELWTPRAERAASLGWTPERTSWSTAAARDFYIPVRRTDIVDALAASGALPPPEREKFRQLCRLLAAIYHHQFFRQLVRDKEELA